MKNNGTVAELFEKAIALERCAEEFYNRLAELFSNNDEVARFWRRIANEESGHARYLQQVRGRLSENLLSTPADGSILAMARRSLSRLDDNFPHIRNLDDAYNLAVELETSETNTIFEFMLVNFPTEELAKSRAFLSIQLKKHASAIQEDLPTRYKSKINRINLPVSN